MQRLGTGTVRQNDPMKKFESAKFLARNRREGCAAIVRKSDRRSAEKIRGQ